ncbi:hypothetical protein AB1M95_00900 [Sulfitobacter sp. LCG007]
MASIMDHGHTPNPRMLHRFADCDSDLALWGILAAKELPRDRPIDADAALRALLKLPPHLRMFLAPALGSRLLQYGDTENAELALRNARRLPEQPLPIATLADADLELNRGNGSEAEELLQDVVQTNTAESPEALIRYVDSRFDAGRGISTETAMLIEAYVHELQDQEMFPEMLRAHALASARSGQFPKAYQAFEEYASTEAATGVDALRTTLLSELVRASDDITFLDIALEQLDPDNAPVAPQVLLATAERLFDLGFVLQARDLLSFVPQMPRDDARQILAARIAIEEGSALRARAALIGLESPEAEALRAQAFVMEGDGTAARDIYDSLDMPEAADSAAWMSQQWVDLVTEDSPDYAAIRSIAARPVAPVDGGDEMLARSADAIEESARARATLAEFLASVPGSDAFDN